jgi:hypothetical protein
MYPKSGKEKYFFELEVVVYVPEIQKLFMELLVFGEVMVNQLIFLLQ